jgi:hypothetical protein
MRRVSKSLEVRRVHVVPTAPFAQAHMCHRLAHHNDIEIATVLSALVGGAARVNFCLRGSRANYSSESVKMRDRRRHVFADPGV